MEWGILFILIMLIGVSYVIVQETRAQLHWRGLVEQGDLDAIRTLVEAEVQHWRESRVPRGTPAMLWHGVQTVELLDVTPTGARVSCNGEGEYSIVGGRRIETSSPLAEGMKITQKLSEMLFYDIPNVKLDHVQIDVYTSFRDSDGHAEPRCVLSSRVERSVVEHIDWEETAATDFATLTEARYADGASDTLKAIEPLPWADVGSAKAVEEPGPEPTEEATRRSS